MSLLLPCSMREYKGTKWYKRLLTAEYRIMMDDGSRHEVIHDYTLSHIDEEDARRERYMEGIRSFFNQSDRSWDKESPFSLLQKLRTLRSSLFSSDELDYSCFESPYSPVDARFMAGQKDELLSRINHAGSVVLIADTERPGSVSSCIASIRSHLDPHLPIRMALGPALTSWPELEDDVETLRLPAFGKVEKKDFSELYGDGSTLIVCADLRYAFAAIVSGVPILTLLSSEDWFASILNGENRDSDDRIAFPATSRYGDILTGVTAVGRGYRYTLWDVPVTASLLSGVNPDPGKKPEWPSWLERLAGSGSITLRSSFYRQKGKGGWIEREHAEPDGLHAASLILDPEKVKVEPLFFNAMSSPDAVPCDSPSLFCSFNYYMTDNLKEWYGAEDSRPLPWRRFLLDYLYIPGKDTVFESLPLYDKTLLGCTHQGRLIAGSFTYTAISLLDSDGGCVRRFTSGDIDPPGDNDPGLYLPRSGPRLVGEGKYCASFIHDQLWDQRPGPVPIPPFGAVLVVPEPLPESSTWSWSVEWDNLPCRKDEIAWLAGGFNALVEEGENLSTDPETAERRLVLEGWMNPLSRSTQETQLEASEVQPRCCIGRTINGRNFLMVVSGRSVVSRGARFSDLSSLALHLLTQENETLDFLVNLDGGASAMLCARNGEDFNLLTYPSPSDNNPAGVVRKVPALLKIACIH